MNKVDIVMTPLNVLVIDDSPLTLKIMASVLTELGHKVIGTEPNGARALVAYRACKPDLVTMDIVMPVVDGIEATRRIIAEFPDARIVIVSSHGQESIVQDAINSGARGYVTKPIKAEELNEQIKLAIANND